MKNSSSHIRTGPAGPAQLTVYFDGSCPLCAAEIAHYRKQAGASQICFRDIAGSDGQIAPDLTRLDAMKRFHVRQADRRLLSGAAVFASIWRLLPRWRWAARLATLPGALMLLEGSYRLFLIGRPALALISRQYIAARYHRQIPVGSKALLRPTG